MKRIYMQASTAIESRNDIDKKGSFEEYSLASSYLISAQHNPLIKVGDIPLNRIHEYEWVLYDLGSLHPVRALSNAQELTNEIMEDEKIQSYQKINCKVEKSSDVCWTIKVKSSFMENEVNDQTSDLLLQTLSKIMIQRAIQEILKENQTIILNVDVNIKTSKSFLQFKFNLDDNLEMKAVINLLFSIKQEDDVELVEMVNSNGNSMGSLPRKLVHQHNILHRGVGIMPVKYSLDKNNNEFDIYVHQRTSTKRIFPSLYDMFVGGVSAMDEDVELTARRELKEELGLSRGDAFSDPLFQCIVCTGYNRCVVTCFRYVCNDLDTIQWQEEEVAWGKFLPYQIVRDAAALSVNRLINHNKWPGEDNVLWALSSSSMNEPNESSKQDEFQWKTWDFVPDGLLVWQAWEEWINEKNTE